MSFSLSVREVAGPIKSMQVVSIPVEKVD